MRPIDADKLIENIKNTADLGGWIGAAVYHIKQVAIKYINDAPSIDAVELGVDYRLDFYEVNYKSWRDENGVEHMRAFCIKRKESE